MVIPDAVTVGIIGGAGTVGTTLIGYVVWQNRKIVTGFFDTLPEIVKAMREMIASMNKHDDASKESHETQCKALGEMTASLQSMNGYHKAAKKPKKAGGDK